MEKVMRILIRHMRASVAGTNRHRGFFKLLRLLGHSRVYYFSKDSAIGHSRMIAASHLAAYGGKLMRCRRPDEVDAFFKMLVAGESQ